MNRIIKIYTILSLLVFTVSNNTYAQQIGNLTGINYQAVAIDENGQEIVGMDVEGKPLYEKEIGVMFSIEKGLDGNVLYQETHTTLTDQYGLFALTIGHGASTGTGQFPDLLSIPWIEADQWLRVEISIENDGNYTLVSLQQFMSVPYSFYTDDIADDAITSSKILNGEVINEDIADVTIDLTTKADGSTATDGQILIGDGASNNFNLANLTAGAGIDIVNSPGGIEISSPPVGVGSDGSFTIPVGSNGVISAGQPWYSPNSLKIDPSPTKPFVMGDIFLVSADSDLQGCILSAYLQSIAGDGRANVQVIIFNPQGIDVTLASTMTFKFLLVK
ncbi:MAG: hypothetical protein OEW67_05950 [Cyclobacteriaceae bacterium]|nr:hypothetical protein [Cyclobacteriaceae bacterium]